MQHPWHLRIGAGSLDVHARKEKGEWREGDVKGYGRGVGLVLLSPGRGQNQGQEVDT